MEVAATIELVLESFAIFSLDVAIILALSKVLLTPVKISYSYFLFQLISIIGNLSKVPIFG
jgi:hypothetical protein